MLPNDNKPWAKPLARTVIVLTVVALAFLTYFLKTHNQLHIPETVGVVLLFLTIVPPNLAVLYPGILPKQTTANGGTHKSAVR